MSVGDSIEIGETRELTLVDSKRALYEMVIEWLSAIMAGEDFVFCWEDATYTFTWDLPNMTHTVVYAAAETDSQVRPILEGTAEWGKFLLTRTR